MCSYSFISANTYNEQHLIVTLLHAIIFFSKVKHCYVYYNSYVLNICLKSVRNCSFFWHYHRYHLIWWLCGRNQSFRCRIRLRQILTQCFASFGEKRNDKNIQITKTELIPPVYLFTLIVAFNRIILNHSISEENFLHFSGLQIFLNIFSKSLATPPPPWAKIKTFSVLFFILL